MKFLLIIIFFLRCLHANLAQEDDLGHFFNVNTITGHLELDFNDIEIEGPVPFTITRSYTTSGALEANKDEVDLWLKAYRASAWMFQGGWTFHPYLNLFVSYSSSAYLQGKRGPNKFISAKPRDFHDADKKHYIYLKPSHKNTKSTGSLSSRHKLRNDFLKISRPEKKGGRAVHYLADGTQRIYHGNDRVEKSYWRLSREILPSRHLVEYEYHSKYRRDEIKSIKIKNPSGKKTFSTILFDHTEFEDEKKLTASCSNGQKFTYFFLGDHKEREHLSTAIDEAIKISGQYHYKPSRKGFGARLGGISNAGKERFRVSYYLPETKKERKKWAHDPYPKTRSDKVRELAIYDPTSGKFTSFATFSYQKNQTKITDYENNETTYCHEDRKLQTVEYRDPKGELHGIVELIWEDDDLIQKRKKDGSGNLIYEKKFEYDFVGNVTRELWQDHASGLSKTDKRLTYTKSQLVKTVREVGGLSYEFFYFPKTNLITCKLTRKNGKIIQREFFFYNEDNLLVKTCLDDGIRQSPNELEGVTFRKIAAFDLDEETGMCKRVETYFYDFEKQCQELSKTEIFTYNEKTQVTQIDTSYELDGPSYTTHLLYDHRGNVRYKNSPLNRVTEYSYDERNLLHTSKEPGSPQKIFTYDYNGRLIACEEAGKTTRSIYDLKGRLCKQIDPYGNAILQEFDSFGNCLSTTLPETLDHPIAPRAEMAYDFQGNIISHSDPLGNTTYTEYNALRKPTRIIHPDQTETQHVYGKAGILLKTIYPDGTEEQYEYDHLQRMTSKQICSKEGDLLAAESWTYSTFHLLSYTNQGLTTHYTYNCKGQKISEETSGRVTTFAYDPFGHIESITKGDWKKVQKHNVHGDIIELWEEGLDGKIENHMVFCYTRDGRKQKATRYTSKGEAVDFFNYDEEGRLICHKDPEGNETKIHYQEIENALGQTVLQKTRIDALGNRQIETFDANSRLISIEKQNGYCQTVSLEEHFHDPAGNKQRRVVTIFDETKPIRTHTTKWEHDVMGRVTKEIEEGEKITTYAYDSMGRVIAKTLPTNVTITYQYDGLGRAIETKSTDGTIHYTYCYKQGKYPTTAWDKIHHLKWEREYNAFDELICETSPEERTMRWKIDDQGRIIKLLLPDKSAIRYSYFGKHLTSVSRYNTDNQKIYAHEYTSFDPWGHVETEEHIYSTFETTTDRDLFERVATTQSPYHTEQTTYGPTGLVEKVDNTLFHAKTYTYDALNQLASEGSQTYQFDSLGNPSAYETNHLNQVLHDEDTHYSYDRCGHTHTKQNGSDTIEYTYDALSRVTNIQTKTSAITYLYDPFSRIYSKEKYETHAGWISTSTTHEKKYYLYDQEKEIGTLDANHQIQELKVLGLGILGEIGAAVALEIQNEVYAPLHDFNGNIIALINRNGKIAETHQPDAFGRSALKKATINPWPYQSKRLEEGLIFFGLRFYDPKLGRFLTPDPAASRVNLYLFVLNSPINRLDLFGLEDEDYRTEARVISINETNTPSLLHAKVYFGDIQTDWLVYSNQFHQLQFTQDELESGTFDILQHFGELLPSKGKGGGLVYGRNGIRTNKEEFKEFGDILYAAMPQNVLTIVEYTPTMGLFQDVKNTYKDKKRKETTNETLMCEQTMRMLLNTLGKVNENLLFVNVLYSRAGAISCAAIDRLERELKVKTKEKMIWFGLGPAEPILDAYCLDSKSVYSKHDKVTGEMGMEFQNKQRNFPEGEKPYNIEFVDWHHWNGFKEHGFKEPTYQTALENFISHIRDKYGFIQDNR